MTILFVDGVGDDNQCLLTGQDEHGNIIWRSTGCSNVADHLGLGSNAAATILMFGPKIDQSKVTFHRPPSLIFNQISEPDLLSGALSRCIDLCNRVSAPVINHPEKVLQTTRDGVSRLLQDIPGVKMPRTLRVRPHSPDEILQIAESGNLGFPIIARLAGFHGGMNMILVRGREDLDDLHAFPYDGRDFFLIEFVDYRDEQGIYIKQRIAVIDKEPYVRSSFCGNEWKVHGARSGAAGDYPENYSYELLMKQAEAGLDMLRPAISAIQARLGLDYFGIDCNVNQNGEMLIFEANASMNMLTLPNRSHAEKIEFLKQRILDMIRRKSSEPGI